TVAFSPDGRRLASAGADKTVRVWNVMTGEEALSLQGHKDVVGEVAFSADGKRLASASGDNTVKLWDAITGRETHTLEREGLTSLGVSTAGVMGSPFGQAPLLAASSLIPGASVLSMAFRPDGKQLATASADNTVRLWDTTTGQVILRLQDHK